LNNGSAAKTKLHLNEVIQTVYGKPIKLMPVCGTDALPKWKSKNAFKEKALIVLNRKMDFDVFQFIADHPYKEQIILAIEDGWEEKNYSSTKIRNNIKEGLPLDDLTDPSIALYMKQHNLL